MRCFQLTAFVVLLLLGAANALDLRACGLKATGTELLNAPRDLGDGFCDDDYNIPECDYDFEDCCGGLTTYCTRCECIVAACATGFQPEGGDGEAEGEGEAECVDINECKADQPPCDEVATCTNTEGSYQCSCPATHFGDGRSGGSGCTLDIDECKEGTSSCVEEATCVNLVGRYECSCPENHWGNGVAASARGTGCVKEVDECAAEVSPCADSQICVNFAPGDDGVDATRNSRSYECRCKDGFHFDGRTGACEDTDECTFYRHNECSIRATCKNTPGTYECTCREGFTGDGKTCVRDSDGSPDPGQETTDVCGEIAPCGDNAVCYNNNVSFGSYSCQCASGYAFAWPDTSTCVDEDECVARPCGIYERCENLVGSYACHGPNADSDAMDKWRQQVLDYETDHAAWKEARASAECDDEE